jgi:hypothetical protein
VRPARISMPLCIETEDGDAPVRNAVT